MVSPEVVRFTEDLQGNELEITKASFPSLSGVQEISLITTAISHVILVSAKEGGFVFKLRRRVKIGDLCDFTTLEKRERDCWREIDKNQALAPDLYLEVVPAVLDDQTLIFGYGDGGIVDWAVKMRRFREEDKMDNRLKEGKVTEEHIMKLAERIAEFHNGLPVPSEAAKYGSFEHVRRIWGENFGQARELIETSAIDLELITRAEERVNKYMESNRGLFAERIEARKVLDCHGDFHTGNVVIEEKDKDEEEDVQIFDALEFNRAYSVHDVASEIGFMAMDLEFHERANFAQLLVGRYVETTGDREMVERGLLNFYKAYRAWVRGKVEAWQSDQEKAESYFSLSDSYLQRL
jgi:aminoglycoside phosphotransferase family enzyme